MNLFSFDGRGCPPFGFFRSAFASATKKYFSLVKVKRWGVSFADMSMEEIRETLREASLLYKEIALESRESQRRVQEMNLRMEEEHRKTEEEHRKTEQSLRELSEQHKETEEEHRKTERALRELSAQQKETEKQLKETNRQLGSLGNKWGTYTEGLAYPSMVKQLRERFGMEHIFRNAKSKKGDRNLEIDFFGYANGAVNRVCIVETKGIVTRDSVEQLENTVARFVEFFPEHREKEIVGILVGASVRDDVAEMVLKKGFYLGTTAEGVFALRSPGEVALT